MKNKIGKSVFVWLFSVTVCSSMLFFVQTTAKDAFVVEEEVIIGTQEQTEIASPVSVPPSVPVEEGTKETAKQEIKKKEPENISEKAAEESETVSQNSSAPIFQVPVRRETIKQKPVPVIVEEEPEKEIVPEELESIGEQSEPVEEPMKEPARKSSWWLLAVGGVFFLSGIARILHRLLIRYGKL